MDEAPHETPPPRIRVKEIVILLLLLVLTLALIAFSSGELWERWFPTE
ncbi:MAG: hypothetical protein KDB73_20335 [Planctomycetes bacterium]|nr:hypothetical protein [Planctomycetota bacterium]